MQLIAHWRHYKLLSPALLSTWTQAHPRWFLPLLFIIKTRPFSLSYGQGSSSIWVGFVPLKPFPCGQTLCCTQDTLGLCVHWIIPSPSHIVCQWGWSLIEVFSPAFLAHLWWMTLLDLLIFSHWFNQAFKFYTINWSSIYKQVHMLNPVLVLLITLFIWCCSIDCFLPSSLLVQTQMWSSILMLHYWLKFNL